MKPMRIPIVIILCGFLLSSGCQKKDVAAGQEATVVLRDGTRISGEISQSTPTQITLKAIDGTAHVLEMRNVRTIDYADATAPLVSTGAQQGSIQRAQRRTANPTALSPGGISYFFDYLYPPGRH